jgi:hypothetical protein
MHRSAATGRGLNLCVQLLSAQRAPLHNGAATTLAYNLCLGLLLLATPEYSEHKNNFIKKYLQFLVLIFCIKGKDKVKLSLCLIN